MNSAKVSDCTCYDEAVCLLVPCVFPFLVYFAVLFVSLLRVSLGMASGFPTDHLINCSSSSTRPLQYKRPGLPPRLFSNYCGNTVWPNLDFFGCLLLFFHCLCSRISNCLLPAMPCHCLCSHSEPCTSPPFLHQPLVSLHLDVHPPLHIPPLFK